MDKIGIFVVLFVVGVFSLGFLLTTQLTGSYVVNHLPDVTTIENGVTCKGWRHENMTFYICDDDTTKAVNDETSP